MREWVSSLLVGRKFEGMRINNKNDGRCVIITSLITEIAEWEMGLVRGFCKSIMMDIISYGFMIGTKRIGYWNDVDDEEMNLVTSYKVSDYQVSCHQNFRTINNDGSIFTQHTTYYSDGKIRINL